MKKNHLFGHYPSNVWKKTLRVMKLTSILLFLATFSVAAEGFSQGGVISIRMDQATLKEVFQELKTHSDYSFVYSDEVISGIEVNSIDVKDATLEQVMNDCLKDTNLEYYVENKVVVIHKKVPEAIQKQKQEKKELKGKVTDKDGVPLPGVSVVVKGTSIGVATDIDGNYTISFDDENTVMVFSFVGMIPQEIAYQGQTDLNLVLNYDTANLEEVVVTGYQTIEQGRATGSYDIVNQDELSRIVSNDVVDKLEGVVPGLLIDSNGDMMIRGQATIYAQTKPLVVVDGFPMEYGTYNINPNDIESISVLKDAASASIWGVRAANGVLVITTKKGSKNKKVKVSYIGNVKIGSKFDISSLGYLNSAQQVDWEREKFHNYPTSINNIALDHPQNFSEAALIEYRYNNGDINNSGRESEFNKLASVDNIGELKKNFYRNSLLQTHNITISGGSESITNYLSVYFENSKGDLIGNKRNSAGAQLNSSFDLNDRIKLTTGFRANYAKTDTYSGEPTQILPYLNITDNSGNYSNEFTGVSQLMKEDLMQKGYTDWSFNRLKDRSLIEDKTQSYNVMTNAQLEINLLKGLTFSTSGMFILDQSIQEILNGENSYYVRDLYNKFTSYDNGTIQNNLPEGAIKNKTHNNSLSYTFRNVLNYKYSKNDFELSFLGGCEAFAIRTKMESDSYFGYDPQGMNYDSTLNLYNLVNQGVAGYSSLSGLQRLSYSPVHSDAEDRYFSTFLTSNISYNNLYTLFGSIRYDKTNLYGRSSKYQDQPTWSIGTKWNISNEKFFNVKGIDLLALKLSYGLSGNVDKTTSPYLIASNSRDVFLGQPVLTIDNPENSQLSWEKVYTFNAGVELALFKNKLNLSADYYTRNTQDALGNMVVDPTNGWAMVRKNTASIKNHGVDLSVGSCPISTEYFKWNSNLTLSYNYNEVEDVNSGEETATMITSGNPLEGRPVDYIYAYRNGGLNSDGQIQVLDKEGNSFLYNETADFGSEDFLIMGRSTPKIFGALSNVFSYKGFELDCILTYKFGHKIIMSSIANAADSDRRIYKSFDQRWRQPGDENNTWIPAVNYSVTQQYIDVLNHNERMIEDGDLIRLKAVGVSYDFIRILKSRTLSELSLKLSAENLWFWAANSEGLDPDRFDISNSVSNYLGTQPTYYTFSFKIGF
ncbi:SusC/RagA family TonB-linked outer membrane protein [Labilibaculum manganireducens]|uniref:SusC/RagA family TonB-linked outer membrane protein n=1 Tax=Labilibaculum manganireducens TaxID=1940525 RepID=UPI0029F5BE68|nr:SusC/RagA family TonB-linked outer membrane protein [Labilibaculum manganireducens]